MQARLGLRLEVEFARTVRRKKLFCLFDFFTFKLITFALESIRPIKDLHNGNLRSLFKLETHTRSSVPACSNLYETYRRSSLLNHSSVVMIP